MKGGNVSLDSLLGYELLHEFIRNPVKGALAAIAIASVITCIYGIGKRERRYQKY